VFFPQDQIKIRPGEREKKKAQAKTHIYEFCCVLFCLWGGGEVMREKRYCPGEEQPQGMIREIKTYF